MTKTGSSFALMAVLASMLATAPSWAAADVEFSQSVDRTKVGTEDTLRLTITVSNAPDGATVQFPAPNDFEVLSRSNSQQMSYQLGPGGSGTIKRTQKYVLVMRANRAGTLKIPPAVLSTGAKDYRTEGITVEVVKGRLGPDPHAAAQRQQSPFGNFPGFPQLPGFPGGADDGDDDAFGIGPDPDIPRSDSDLFVRASVDKDTAYVGEQVTLTITIYSRVDLASVDSVTMPKLEGFWSEDLDTPTQLAPEQRVLGGVPYRAYLLRRRALFAVKPGALDIGAAEADITTGFLFAGHRVHRKGNALSVKVKPLPPNASGANVGKWRLSTELSQSEVNVGTPVQVRVVLEGKGNLKNATMPRLEGPAALKVYEPTTTDKVNVSRGTLGGRRVMEYVVLPQQTGTFTLPGLTLKSFNPESQQVEDSQTDPLVLTVKPGAGGATVIAAPGISGLSQSDSPKNRLEAGGLKSLRHTARFTAPSSPTFRQPWFMPALLSPFVLALCAAAVSMAARLRRTDDASAAQRRLAKAARARLAAATKLRAAGKTQDFYNEVEKALMHFLEAKLRLRAVGLTRDQLDQRMATANVSEAVRHKVRAVLDTCDMGRFAPGMGEDAARGKALDEAADAMQAWESK